MYVCTTYVCMYVCTYVYTYVCIYVHTYVCVYVCMYVCTSLRMSTRVFIISGTLKLLYKFVGFVITLNRLTDYLKIKTGCFLTVYKSYSNVFYS